MSVLTNPQDPAQAGPVNGYEGLTKREHFACEAMKALLSDKDTIFAVGTESEIGEYAVKVADDLVKALNR